MEKIERLAKLKPDVAILHDHADELFKILRGLVVLDWILRNPNDLGKKKSEAKFQGLMEKAFEVMDKIQARAEDEAEVNERLVELTDGK